MTRTDFVQRPAAVKTGLEIFSKKKTLMRNLVREIGQRLMDPTPTGKRNDINLTIFNKL